MSRLAPLVALLLVACSASSSSPPQAAPPEPLKRAPRPAPAPVAPYQGAPGTCSLDGLSIDLYSARDPRWGSLTAPVAIVLFSDFECPFCGKQRHSLDELKVRYGADKLQIIWKHMPLSNHPSARPAADVAQAVFEAAGPDAFWKFHDLVYSHRKALTSDNFIAWASEAGVPPERLKTALEQPTVPAKISEDVSLARAVGLTATPMLIINGLPLIGFHEAAELSPVIDEELSATPTPGPHNACDRMRDAWAPAPGR